MALKVDELVEKYIKLREKQSQLKAEYDLKNKPLEELKDKIEAVMLAKFNEMGVESFKTAAGTAYASVRTSASLADWDAYKAFITKQEDPFEFLDRRVSKTAIEQYKASNDDLPPGVNWTAARVVNFRRS